MTDLRTTLSSTALVALLALGPVASAADVWTVPGDAATVQGAVDLAGPGDVVLVAPGDYPEAVTVVGKGITLVADGAASLLRCYVRDVPAGQVFVLDGFTLDPLAAPGAAITAFAAENDDGPVRVQHCTILGNAGFAGSTATNSPSKQGLRAASVIDAHAAFHHCTIEGGDGADLTDAGAQFFATAGGPGLTMILADVALYDTTVSGGRGGSYLDATTLNAPAGGVGIDVDTSSVSAHGTTLVGGDGGAGNCVASVCGNGGKGGDGIVQRGSGVASILRGATFEPGAGGAAGGPGAFAGQPGSDVQMISGTKTEYVHAYRGFDADSPVREGGPLTLTFEGQVGDTLLLFAALNGAHLAKPLHEGIFHLGGALLLPGFFVAVMPDGLGGVLPVSLTVPELGGSLQAVDLHLQAVNVADGVALLGPPQVVTMLDASL